jgi:hypothetical protein
MAVVIAIILVTELLANSVSAQVRLRLCQDHLETSLIRPSIHRFQFQLRIRSVFG